METGCRERLSPKRKGGGGRKGGKTKTQISTFVSNRWTLEMTYPRFQSPPFPFWQDSVCHVMGLIPFETASRQRRRSSDESTAKSGIVRVDREESIAKNKSFIRRVDREERHRTNENGDVKLTHYTY